MRLLALSALVLGATNSVEAQAANVLHYWDDCYAYSPAPGAGAVSGDTVTDFLSDGVGFQAAYAGGGYDLVDVESNCYALPAEVLAAVDAAVADGVPVRFSYWDMDVDAGAQAAMGVGVSASFSTPEDIVDAGAYAFAGGTLATDPADAVYLDNGDYLTGGTTFATAGTTSIGSPIGVETSAGLTNGFTLQDAAQLDPLAAEQYLANQWAHLLGGGGGPTLRFTGACPGMITIDIRGLTPGDSFAAARSSSLGAFVVPSGGCAGTTLGLASPSLVGVFPTGSGSQSFMPTIGAGSCGDYVQVVDMASCQTSNIEQF